MDAHGGDLILSVWGPGRDRNKLVVHWFTQLRASELVNVGAQLLLFPGVKFNPSPEFNVPTEYRSPNPRGLFSALSL